MLWLWVRDWILWVANFRFPFSEICIQNQWWHKLLRPSWGLQHPVGSPSSITVRMEYWRAFQYWYFELCVENRWGRKHFVNFYSLTVGGGVRLQVLFRASWNRIFFQPVFLTFKYNLIEMRNTALIFPINNLLHIISSAKISVVFFLSN